jgi:hypothetical protein
MMRKVFYFVCHPRTVLTFDFPNPKWSMHICNELISDNTNYVRTKLNTTPELLPSAPCSYEKLNLNTVNDDDNILTKVTEDHQHCRPTTQSPEWMNKLPLIETSKPPTKLNASKLVAGKYNVLRESDNAIRKLKVRQNVPNEPSLTEILESNPRSATHSSQFFGGLPLPYRDKYGTYH